MAFRKLGSPAGQFGNYTMFYIILFGHVFFVVIQTDFFYISHLKVI